MAQTTHFVGLDVHANQSHAGILDRETGELGRRRLHGDPLVVLPLIAELGPGAQAVYEAGPTGFALTRAAAERDLVVRVCAPGLIPRKPADRVKTDARDAERLARLLAAGELSFVRVPSVEEEQLRDLVRAREDLRGDLSRARQRLSHFLRRRALRFAGPGKSWETMRATARSLDGKLKQRVEIRDHSLTTDEPTDHGGDDSAPSPQELLAASLASCTAITMEMYAARKGWDVDEIEVDVDYEPAQRGSPTRFTLEVRLPKELPEDQRERLMQIGAKCPVHRTLEGEVMFEESVELI